MKYKTILSIVLVSFLTGQVEPAKELHRNPPRVWALTNAIIHSSPTITINDGTVIIRNGMITNVGSKIKIPNQATILDMNGKHIYAGFIESWLDVQTTIIDTSLQAYWNSNMRAYLNATAIFQPKDKMMKNLRALGFTTAHIVPKGGIFQGASGLVQLGDKPKVLSNNVAQVIEYVSGGWQGKEYPSSLLGTISFIRQGFIDASWYEKSLKILEKYPDGNEPIQMNRSLSSLSLLFYHHPLVAR